MIEQGVKIIGLPLGTVDDDLWFPVSDIDGSYRVSWEMLKADLLGGYDLYAHDVPGSTDEIVTLKNLDTADLFTIFELRAPENSATMEATLSLHNYSDLLGEDWVRDVSLHNYSGDMRAVDVLSNFTNATRGTWHWVSKAMDGGSAVDKTCATLDGDDGYLYLLGNLMPMVSDSQNLGTPDVFWSNVFAGYGVFVACRATSFRFYDEATETTLNGATGTFTTSDEKTITVKAGIITGII